MIKDKVYALIFQYCMMYFCSGNKCFGTNNYPRKAFVQIKRCSGPRHQFLRIPFLFNEEYRDFKN